MKTFTYPLTAYERKQMFLTWVHKNPQAIALIEKKALEINEKVGRVSAKYLMEWMRYEVVLKSNGVEFIDIYGKAHRYRINNTDAPELARYLKKKYPHLKIELRTQRSVHGA